MSRSVGMVAGGLFLSPSSGSIPDNARKSFERGIVRKSNIDIIRQMLRDGWDLDFIAKDLGIQLASVKRVMSRAEEREAKGKK